MLTKMFALLHRGLRHDARLLKVHLMRLGMVVIVVFMLFITQLQSMFVGAPGLSFFQTITWTTLIFSTLAGATFFATTITEEKEEQTLGLLALANISPAALIMGKFLPRLVGAVLIVSALFPFTLLSITLGGVTWNQVWSAYWSLLTHVMFIGSIGLLCSVVCKRSSVAVVMAVAGVIAFLVLPKVISTVFSTLMASGVAIPGGSRLQEWSEAAVQTSVVVRILAVMETGFDEGPFGLQVITNLIGAASLMLFSWAIFAPFNRLTESTTETVSLFSRSMRLSRASRRSWRWPVAWKDFHYQLVGGVPGCVVRGIFYVGVAAVVGLGINGFRFNDELRVTIGESLMAVVLSAVVVELLFTASCLFPAEIRQGTWSSLVTLPVSIGRVAYGKVGGACLGLVPAIICFLIGGVLVVDRILIGDFEWGFRSLVLVIGLSPLYLILLHLIVLYSLLVNQWLAAPLALLTMFIMGCMTGGFTMPVMLIAAVAESGGIGEMAMAALMLSIFGFVALGICFGLQMMIAQQLRAVAAR